MWQALPEDSTGWCAWLFLQGFGVPSRTKTTTPRASLTRDPGQRAKTFAQKWRRLENFVGLAGTTNFPFLYWALWFSTDLPLSTRG